MVGYWGHRNTWHTYTMHVALGLYAVMGYTILKWDPLAVTGFEKGGCVIIMWKFQMKGFWVEFYIKQKYIFAVKGEVCIPLWSLLPSKSANGIQGNTVATAVYPELHGWATVSCLYRESGCLGTVTWETFNYLLII